MENDYEFNVFQQIKNVSYLRARDPTINWVLDNRSKVKINLRKEKFSEASNIDNIKQDDNHIQVHLRIKKVNNCDELYEVINENTLMCKVPESARCLRKVHDSNSVSKSFMFSKIFGPESTQDDLFNNVVKENVLKFINGLNCSLLTYGASGSGKTFTIVGTTAKPGIIPRALEYLFRTLPLLPEKPEIKPNVYGGIIRLSYGQSKQEMTLKETLLKELTNSAQHTRTYRAMQQRLSQERVASLIDEIENVDLSIWVSFAEIYNEHVYDLLKPRPQHGQLRPKLRLGRSNNSAYIKDLTSIHVSSGLEAYQILQYGLQNLKYEVTSLNDHSSRSHSIFTIKLAQASGKMDGVCVNAFNFCDLAGSERLKKTNNIGDRLKESNNINTSLLVLGRCMSLVRDSQKSNDKALIPFRESKLTQLFQNALMGQETISMIVNISPAKEMFDETQHALNFSTIAKDVLVEQPPGKRLSKNRFSRYVDTETRNVQIEEIHEKIEWVRSRIAQHKIDTELNNQHIIKSYQEIIKHADVYGKERFHKLLAESTQTAQDYDEFQNKRQKLSVIILDTSLNDDDEDKYQINSNDESRNIKLKDDLIRSEMEIKRIDGEKNKTMMENKYLEKTLEDAKSSYLNLKNKYQNTIKHDSLRLLKEQEKYRELHSMIVAVHKQLGVLSDVSEKKENTNSQLFGNLSD